MIGDEERLEARADAPFVDGGAGDFGEELGRLLPWVAGVGFGPEARVEEVELFAGAGDGDVEETAFLFEAEVAAFLDGAEVREHALGEPDDEDDLPFEAFGLMDGGEDDGFAVLGFGGVCGFGAAEEGEIGEEILEGFVAIGEGHELEDVFGA
jgi:hypothetical protein